MDESGFKSNDEIEINLWEIIGVLWKNAVIIILCGILFAAGAFAYTKVFVTPEYQSTTKMYVLSQQSSDTITQGDMQTSTYLTKDYAELIKSRTVTEAVIADLGLDMSSATLLSKISVSTPADTRVVEIRVIDEDPNKAAEMANEVRNAAGEHIQSVMNIEAVNTVEDANIPSYPISPNTMQNTVVGGMAGGIIIIAILIITYLTNDAIQTNDDIEKHLGLSVLGIIPLKEEDKKSRRRRKRKVSRRNKMGRGA